MPSSRIRQARLMIAPELPRQDARVAPRAGLWDTTHPAANPAFASAQVCS
jgi:hypothetical protein